MVGGARAPAEAGRGYRPPPRMAPAQLLVVAAALLAGVSNYAVLRARDDRVRVAVTTAAVPAGSAVADVPLAFTAVGIEDDVGATLVGAQDLSAVAGYVTAFPLAPGELLHRSDLVRPAAPARLRAMSVAAERARAAGGALVPGDRVDVIERRDGQPAFALLDVPVLAVADDHGDSQGRAGEGATITLTLAVAAEGALRLAGAIAAGPIEVVRATGADAVPVAASPAPAAASTSPASGG